MNLEDMIRMARESGFELNMWQLSVGCEATGTHEELERFAALVAAAERDRFNALLEDYHVILETLEEMQAAVTAERNACAKVLDEMADQMEADMEPSTAIAWVRNRAAVIRARSQA